MPSIPALLELLNPGWGILLIGLVVSLLCLTAVFAPSPRCRARARKVLTILFGRPNGDSGAPNALNTASTKQH